MEENYKNGRIKGKTIAKFIITFIVLIVLLISSLNSFKTIPEGHLGVKYTLGRIDETGIEPGLNIVIPFIQKLEKVDMREQIYEAVTSAYTKDTQTVEGIDYTVNYSLMASELPNVIRTIGINSVESKLVVPQANSILKNTVGQFNAEELVQNRDACQEQVEEALRESLIESGINVSSFNIKNIDFTDTFEASIAAKVEAAQLADQRRNETVTKEEEAKQKLIAAQADADAAKLAAEAEAYAIELIQKQLSSSPEYVQLQMVEKWNGVFPQVMGNEINPFTILNSDENYTDIP